MITIQLLARRYNERSAINVEYTPDNCSWLERDGKTGKSKMIGGQVFGSPRNSQGKPTFTNFADNLEILLGEDPYSVGLPQIRQTVLKFSPEAMPISQQPPLHPFPAIHIHQ